MMKSKKGEINLIDRRTVFVAFAAFVAYYIVFQAFYNKVVGGTFFPYSGLPNMLLCIVLNFIPIFIMFVIDVTIIFHIRKIKDIRLKLAFDFLLTNVAVVVVDILFLLLMSRTPYGALNWTGTFFNNFILFFVIETAYYFVHFQRKARELEKKEQTALRYRYNALKAQVTPHFVFNSLNILSALVSLDQEKAKEFINRLSQIYRYTLTKQDIGLATLDEELAFMKSYVEVMAMRYNGKFSVRIEGEELAGRQSLPPYTLQLLIENITKHNTISARLPMEVTITVSSDEVRISNPIRYRYSDSPSHFGLRYLTELYASYGRRFRIENDGKTFTAHIPYIDSAVTENPLKHY